MASGQNRKKMVVHRSLFSQLPGYSPCRLPLHKSPETKSRSDSSRAGYPLSQIARLQKKIENKMSFVEHYKRSIAKTITYRIVILIASYFVFFQLTHNQQLAIESSLLWNLIGLVLYFIHERLWNKTNWGKHSQKISTSRG